MKEITTLNLHQRWIGFRHNAAQLLQTAERAGTIRAAGKVAEPRGALSNTAKHGIAMRDGFVAGKSYCTQYVFRGTNDQSRASTAPLLQSWLPSSGKIIVA